MPEDRLTQWLLDPEFSEDYRSARRKAYHQAIGMAVRYCPLAINTLAKVMADPASPAAAKVAAAGSIMRMAADIEMEDLSARLDSIDVYHES